MAILLDELPTEIIHSIFVYVLDTSPHTAKALSRTNECLSEAVRVISSRRKTIKLNDEGDGFGPMYHDLSKFENTHYLTVESSNGHNYHFLQPNFFVQLIERIKNLKILIWNVGPISIEVLEALGRLHPTCSLRIFKWWRSDEELNHLDPSEIALTKFKNLTHLRYVTTSDGVGSNSHRPYAWEVFQEIVAASKGLELASFLNTFIMRDSDDPGWLGNALSENGQPMSLPTYKKPKLKCLKSLTLDCPDFQLSSSTLDQIGTFTDLSALEYLKISRGQARIDYFQAATTLLPNLKHISINFAGMGHVDAQAAKEYLLACSPVQTLSLWGWTSVIELTDLLARHGQTLEVLQLHQKEFTRDSMSKTTMDSSDIKLIKESCPRLTDLTVDLTLLHSKREVWLDPNTLEALKDLVDNSPHIRKFQIYHASHELYVMLLDIAMEEDKALLKAFTTKTSDGDGRNGDTIDNQNHENEDDSDWNEDGINDTGDPYLPTPEDLKVEEMQGITFRRKHLVPLVEPYVTGLWKTLYGGRTTGGRFLDVKFGDWENRRARIAPRAEPRTFCEVKPHERDDRNGQCVVKTKLWSRSESNGI